MRPAVIAAAEMRLEERVEDDEEVAAAHLAQPELRLAPGAVRPGDRHDAVVMAADDRLERHLDREVEVVRQQRLDVVDDLATVRLECIRRVVVAVPEEHADAEVHHAVDDQLQLRVVAHGRTGYETRPKRAVVSALEDLVIDQEIAWVI